MAQRAARRGGATQASSRDRRRSDTRDPRDGEGIIPVLAKTVRQVEAAAQRGKIRPTQRTAYQVVALLVREERARVKTDATISEAERTNVMTRLDGIATILAKTAARDTSLLALLADGATVSPTAASMRNDMLRAAGREVEEEPEPEPEAESGELPAVATRRAVPATVIARQLANPFLAPDFSAARTPRPATNRLASWELLSPLFRSFEYGGDATSMPLPEASEVVHGIKDLVLMPHQAELVGAAADGHRTFLLADEPGLGKTAQALLAANAADAFPLLVVVPNVVKANWAHEAALWTPRRTATVVHGDGDSIDGFADIVIVNYEILDRHVGWLGSHGFRGMVVDEAHFIKNKTSQRSQHVLALSERIRERIPRALFMALTGTPLINDIEDFRAIWQFLGWIDDKKPRPALMAALEATGLAPSDPGFYSAARTAVINQGIVRRRKVDVAADIPARRVADLPVELDGAMGRSIRAAEAELAARLVERYESTLAARAQATSLSGVGGGADSGAFVDGIDLGLVRRVAAAELKNTGNGVDKGDNVFTLMRKIGQAKAELAADYAAQLARNVGKVVFFAKHLDVMDVAEATFAKRDIGYASIRGDQTPKVRKANIEAFLEDPSVSVIVCSLTAAGVGLNLQVASNVVLAELSWTSAEQTQAIDRVHRIGQTEPVTAWRIIAAQTIDSQLAQLIDDKAGLAARALDGSDEEVGSSADVQLEALVSLLTDALEKENATSAAGTGVSGPAGDAAAEATAAPLAAPSVSPFSPFSPFSAS
ncbi:DEAD/DEAH box helicase [Knoellia subterranea]|uniref:Helicase n=1 Tax=Knoellia subterranea KCTC 19937 TaxID=1385521 RepID=A0A0A0JRQ9_9MICO|nr:DEAD/DEAH box helicase [Knoellia subterranea]KGN38291.1 helicase [Knoellia subterranea KCTC 19937]